MMRDFGSKGPSRLCADRGAQDWVSKGSVDAAVRKNADRRSTGFALLGILVANSLGTS